MNKARLAWYRAPGLLLSDPIVTTSPSPVQMYQRHVRRRFRKIASKVWNCIAMVRTGIPARLCVIFAMDQVQCREQILLHNLKSGPAFRVYDAQWQHSK